MRPFWWKTLWRAIILLPIAACAQTGDLVVSRSDTVYVTAYWEPGRRVDTARVEWQRSIPGLYQSSWNILLEHDWTRMAGGDSVQWRLNWPRLTSYLAVDQTWVIKFRVCVGDSCREGDKTVRLPASLFRKVRVWKKNAR